MTQEYAGMLMGFGTLILFTAIIIVVVIQIFKTMQLRILESSEIARDEAYRKLSEGSIEVQKKMSEDISDLRERVASMEKMLSEVE